MTKDDQIHILRAALKEVVEVCDMLDDASCRDVEPYEFEVVWDDAFRRAAGTLKATDPQKQGEKT